jgi:hypothetical protein
MRLLLLLSSRLFKSWTAWVQQGRCQRRRGRRGRQHQQQQPGVTLDLDRLHQTGGDPGAGSLRQPLANAPNPRVRVLERPSSPSSDPPAYRLMEPSGPVASPWGHREPPCVVHGTGMCPYPVAQWQPMFSSPGDREGEEVIKEEDEAAGEEEDDVVVIAIIDKDDESVEVISVPESTPPRSSYKQMTRIRIGPCGRPTRTLASREGAREAGSDSPEAGSAVWPPPPPPPPSEPVTTTPHHRRAATQAPRCHHKIPTSPMSNHHSGAPSRAKSFTASPTS